MRLCRHWQSQSSAPSASAIRRPCFCRGHRSSAFAIRRCWRLVRRHRRRLCRPMLHRHRRRLCRPLLHRCRKTARLRCAARRAKRRATTCRRAPSPKLVAHMLLPRSVLRHCARHCLLQRPIDRQHRLRCRGTGRAGGRSAAINEIHCKCTRALPIC